MVMHRVVLQHRHITVSIHVHVGMDAYLRASVMRTVKRHSNGTFLCVRGGRFKWGSQRTLKLEQYYVGHCGGGPSLSKLLCPASHAVEPGQSHHGDHPCWKSEEREEFFCR